MPGCVACSTVREFSDSSTFAATSASTPWTFRSSAEDRIRRISGTRKETRLFQQTMGLVPSDLTGLGHHNSGLVKVWFCLGSAQGRRGSWQAKEDCEVWVRHPISFTTSWVQNFILKQRTRIAKHRTKRPKKMCFIVVCLVGFSKLLKGSKKVYSTSP